MVGEANCLGRFRFQQKYYEGLNYRVDVTYFSPIWETYQSNSSNNSSCLVADCVRGKWHRVLLRGGTIEKASPMDVDDLHKNHVRESWTLSLEVFYPSICDPSCGVITWVYNSRGCKEGRKKMTY